MSKHNAVLAELIANNGAILYWQITDRTERMKWSLALNDGAILFDEDTDCYVHPLAVRISTDGYSMPQS